MNRRKKQRSRGGHGGGGAHESAGDGDGNKKNPTKQCVQRFILGFVFFKDLLVGRFVCL